MLSLGFFHILISDLGEEVQSETHMSVDDTELFSVVKRHASGVDCGRIS